MTSGWVDTSAGRVVTTVRRTMSFANSDLVTDAGLTQSVRQSDSGAQTVRTSRGAVTTHRYDYPLAVDYSAARYVDDQNFELTAHVDMSRIVSDSGTGVRPGASRENVDTRGLLARTDGVTSASDGSSTSSFVGTDDRGRPYLHRIVTRHGLVVSDRASAQTSP